MSRRHVAHVPEWPYGCAGGGKCQGGRRCSMHAAKVTYDAMIDRGWAVLHPQILQATTDIMLTLGRIATANQIDMQVAETGWNTQQDHPTYGVWAPRLMVALIDTTMAVMKVTNQDAEALIKAARSNGPLAEAIDAAYRLGGAVAVVPVIEERLRLGPPWG